MQTPGSKLTGAATIVALLSLVLAHGDTKDRPLERIASYKKWTRVTVQPLNGPIDLGVITAGD